MMNFLPISIANAELPTGFDYPPGLYRLKVAAAELKTNKSGEGQHVHVVSKIQMGPETGSAYNGKPVHRRYALTANAAGFLKRLYIACGYTEQDLQAAGQNVSLDWLIEREYIAQIIVVKDTGNRDVTNERPISSWNDAIAASGNSGAAQQKVAQPSLLQPVLQPVQMPPAAQAPNFQQVPQQVPQQQQYLQGAYPQAAPQQYQQYQQFPSPQLAPQQAPQQIAPQQVPQQVPRQQPFPVPQMAPQQQQQQQKQQVINPFPAPVPPPGQVG